MGYRSTVRIITSKKGFDELTKYVKDRLVHIDFKGMNLLDSLDIDQTRGNQKYFGWDDIKWYEGCEGYENVTAIKDGLEHLVDYGYGYRFARIGDEYDDYEESYDDGTEDWLEWIYLSRRFDDEGVL